MAQVIIDPPEQWAPGHTKPPYCPFLTFKNFVQKFKETGIPHRIDKSVMHNLSGAAQSHLLSALRFLALVGDDDAPGDWMSTLVENIGGKDWPGALGSLIDGAYKPLLDGISLKSATPAQISEAFKAKGGTDGSVTDKAVRFYLKALDEAEIDYSAHLKKKPGPRIGSRRRKQSVDDNSVGGDGNNPRDDSGGRDHRHAGPPPGMISFPIHLPGKAAGEIVVPNDIDEAEVELVEAAIAYLRLYAKRNSANHSNSTRKNEGRKE